MMMVALIRTNFTGNLELPLQGLAGVAVSSSNGMVSIDTANDAANQPMF